MFPDVGKLYADFFGASSNVQLFQAPGRVNLIGEHTDYNNGFVLPTPISRYIWLAGKPRQDNLVRVYADDFNKVSEFNLKMIKYSKREKWSNYVRGVASKLQETGFKIRGANMVLKGNVPLGAGLSSSAALETVTLRAFKAFNRLKIDPIQMAYIGKAAENDFVGVQCGIMDQFVSGLGIHGEALFIDCETNEYESHRLFPSYHVVIVNTMKTRKLYDSAYNERRSQCQEAVRLLKKRLSKINSLRDVSTEDLREHWGVLPPLIQKRARHVITENERVLESVQLLKVNDAESFGGLMYDSHDSLRHDYEVSCRELDVLVGATEGLRGVVGARMTGAGFGGCTVNLVEMDHIDNFIEIVSEKYLRGTGKKAEFYLA